MKDGELERWLSNPDAAPPGAVDLLRVAQRPSPPSPEVRARLGRELQQLASTPAFPAPRWPFISGIAVVAVGAAGWLALPRWHTAPPAVAVAPVAARHVAVPIVLGPPPQPLTVAEPMASAPAERPAPSAPPVRSHGPRRAWSRLAAPRSDARAAKPALLKTAPSGPATGADSLAREEALIEAARRTVHARPAAALETLEIHRSEFPAGQLGAEREFLAVSALVQLGRHAEAEARGRRLAAQYPGTTYAQRVQRLLSSGP